MFYLATTITAIATAFYHKNVAKNMDSGLTHINET